MRLPLCGMTVGACLALAHLVSATTWYVDENGQDCKDCGSIDSPCDCGTIDSPCATIQCAIDHAVDGDSIEVWPGTYRGTGHSVAHIEDKSLTLYARDGMGVTFIDGENERRGLLCEPLVVVDEVGIKVGGYDKDGGHDQGFTIQNCLGVEFHEELPGGSCYARECGGGLFVHTDQSQTDALVKVEWCLFQNNTAAWGGGAAFYDSTAALTNCTFRSNTAAGSCDGFGGGVGIGEESNVELHFCDFVDNHATYGGGGSQRDSKNHHFICSSPFNSEEEVCLAECDLVDDWNGEDCLCDEGQPACYFRHYGGAYFNGCTFVNNTAESAGGGLCCSDIIEDPYARTYLSGCVFTGNEAGERGGGLMGPVGHLVMTDCHFDSNQANICLSQSANQEEGGGGVMLWATDYTRMTDCSFVNNGTYGQGGAIFCRGTLRLLRTHFEANWAQGRSLSEGGAIYAMHYGTEAYWLAFDQCEFIDNVAGTYGGAICTNKAHEGLFLVTDCLFVRNRASYDSCQSCLECMDCEDDGVDPYCESEDGYDCVASCTRGGLDGDPDCDHAKKAEGGAIYQGGYAMTLERCCFFNNDATSELSVIDDELGFNDGHARGGAIARWLNRPMEIRNCVFAENSVSAWCDQFDTTPDCVPANYDSDTGYGCGEALGGAIFDDGGIDSLTIEGTLFCGNTEPVISADNGYDDGGGNEFAVECPVLHCEGDYSCDGRVDVEDILAVLNGWDNPYDVNDVLNVIGNWGCTVNATTVCVCADSP